MYIFLGIIIVLGLFVWGSYNSLIGAKIKVQEGFSAIDVQLKRRTDLIPNLVETVKGYAKHEKEVLENITKDLPSCQPKASKIKLRRITNSPKQ